jgi:PAT family beta-lactamase induction signal transducer AmpG
VLPHAPWVFVLALVGAFLFQAFSFAAQAGIIFEVIGRNNPLAATTFTFLVAASNIPLTYMLVVDGRGYAWRGVAGSFIVDAAVSITACLVMGLVLSRLSGNAFGSGTEVAETIHILTEES